MQPDTLADLVVLTVKSAMAPLLERLAAAEARALAVGSLEKTLAEIRDRLVVTETKAAIPPPPDAELRDRVVALEHKASPTFEVPTDIVTRLSAVEARPLPVDKALDLSPILERLVKLEARLDAKIADTLPILASVADLSKDLVTVREKVAAVDARAGVPGPPGKDGANGLDGADGVGWDDLVVEHDGERGFAVKLIRGERSKDAGTFTIPAMIYRGVYTEGRTYDPGDVVTYGGSTWHCHKSTVLKPDTTAVEAKGPNGRDFWTMAVKQGREGKPGRDGRDATTSLPVVSVGGRQA